MQDMPAEQPQEAPAEPQAEGPAPGDAVKIAQDVGAGLAQLGEMLNGSPQASDDEKAQMAQIMEMFTDLVERKLGGGGDAPQPADPGVVSADAGMQGVPMGPQARM